MGFCSFHHSLISLIPQPNETPSHGEPTQERDWRVCEEKRPTRTQTDTHSSQTDKQTTPREARRTNTPTNQHQTLKAREKRGTGEAGGRRDRRTGRARKAGRACVGSEGSRGVASSGGRAAAQRRGSSGPRERAVWRQFFARSVSSALGEEAADCAPEHPGARHWSMRLARFSASCRARVRERSRSSDCCCLFVALPPWPPSIPPTPVSRG